MSETRFYNIHNLVRVSSNVACAPEYFEVSHINDKKLDLAIEEKDFSFDKSGLQKIGLKFFSGRNELYAEQQAYGMPMKKILLSNLLGRSRLLFNGRSYKSYNLKVLINAVLEIKLLQKGCTFVHAGAVSKDEKGYLISAWSEAGKSSTIFGLTKKRGFGILGDDTVLLSKTGFVYSWPVKTGIFLFSNNIGDIGLSASQRAMLVAKYIATKLPPLHLYIKPKLKIDLSKIGKITNKAKIYKTYFLENGVGEKVLKKTSAIERLMATTLQANAFFKHEMLLAYYYSNNIDPNFIEKGMERIFKAAIGRSVALRDKNKEFYDKIAQ